MVDDPETCEHRWVLDATQAVRLSGEDKLKHPNCIGREASCKKCGSKTTKYEKVWDGWSS